MRGPNAAMTAHDTPASAGEHGPGLITSLAGRSASTCSTVTWSLRTTFSSAPSSPKYCTRLKVNES
jgi:hypothetical protein